MMLKRKSLATLTPACSPETRESWRALIQEHPWVIPATVALQVLPATVMVHGFWKTRQLKKQLQIEREKTKQLTLNQYRPGVPRPLKQLAHHHVHFDHD